MPINPKTYSCYGLKKIHTRNLITKKIPAARKFLTSPISFLMVRPLLPLIQIVNKLITNDETQDNNNNLRVTT